MHRRRSNPSRENYGFFLMRWGSEVRGEGGKWGLENNEKREMDGKGLPLSGWAPEKKVTSLKLKEAVHYECSSFFFNRFDASK